jgi:hypothetical protein
MRTKMKKILLTIAAMATMATNVNVLKLNVAVDELKK